jgi:hypothetical protein
MLNLFDPAQHLPEEVGEILNHQTDLPRIAKDKKLITSIEAKLEQLPTRHDLYHADSRAINFLKPESIQLVVTSPTYWTLKDYNVNEGQLGYIADYDKFLDELDRVWKACFDALVPGRPSYLRGWRRLSVAKEKQRRAPGYALAQFHSGALQKSWL